MPEKVAVIGAGIAGIAVSIRLAVKGYSVSVFEQNEQTGGKMNEFRHERYRFDTGPSLFTLPESIEELFKLAGEDIRDHLQYRRLDEVCRYFYEDGMTINAYSDPENFARELVLKTGEDHSSVMAYLEKSREIFSITEPVFLRKSLHQVRNYLSPDFFKSFLQVYKIKPFTTLHDLNRKYFRHKNSVRIFDRFATYNGSDPYRTPSTLMVISHLEHNLGAYFPSKGMFEIARSLTGLAERLGVTFHLNSKAEEVIVRGNKVEGIRLADGTRFDCSMAVSDIDIWHLYKNLLKSVRFPEKWFRHERSTSALIFYWGMEIRSEKLSLHNILFSKDYEQEFRDLFSLKKIHSDPTVYIFISSKEVPSDAPAGCENWFVMVNAPENTGQDWERMIADCRLSIFDKIHKYLGIDVEKHRKFEFVLDPRGIETKTASYRGSLYGSSSNSMWSAFRRHPNFSGIKGMYFTGGSVHPGGGIPLCLNSAEIVSDLIDSK